MPWLILHNQQKLIKFVRRLHIRKMTLIAHGNRQKKGWQPRSPAEVALFCKSSIIGQDITKVLGEEIGELLPTNIHIARRARIEQNG